MTCFSVITTAEDLTPAQELRAKEAGPPEVQAEKSYPSLMAAAGFEHIDVVDVTADYLATSQAWLDAWRAEAVALRRLVGAGDFEERQRNLRASIAATRDGLLRRYVVTAVKA